MKGPHPQDILSQVNFPKRWGGAFPTYSGILFRPFEPDPDKVKPEDVMFGLAHTFRYGGHVDPPITVAEHAVLVSQIVRILWGPRYVPFTLLHDAAESYLHDIQDPLKAALEVRLPGGEQVSWAEMEDRLLKVILEALGVDPQERESEEFRAADMLARSFERRDAHTLEPVPWLPDIPPEVAHLRVRFWSPALAYTRYKDAWIRAGLPQ